MDVQTLLVQNRESDPAPVSVGFPKVAGDVMVAFAAITIIIYIVSV
jgi:hypothetical protein